MKGFWKEFKEFALRGNVLDMAVGVVIGGAFTSLVNSLVASVFTPLIGLVKPGTSFAQWKLGPVEIGAFLNAVLSFILLTFCVFLLVRFVNVFRQKKAAPAPKPTKEELLLTEIRDLLKEKRS